MNDMELRALLPIRIVRGGLLRADGGAVGIAAGGAPGWDLRSSASQARVAAEYHRLLLAQELPIDIFNYDSALDLADEIGEIYRRGNQSDNPAAIAILDELADYLDDHSSATMSRHRSIVWTVTVAAAPAGLPVAGALGINALFQRATPEKPRQQTALAEAIERARRLADALATLGGTPPPRLLEAEEIARLIFRLVDPIRAARYPLAGTLLDRVRQTIE